MSDVVGMMAQAVGGFGFGKEAVGYTTQGLVGRTCLGLRVCGLGRSIGFRNYGLGARLTIFALWARDI